MTTVSISAFSDDKSYIPYKYIVVTYQMSEQGVE